MLAFFIRVWRKREEILGIINFGPVKSCKYILALQFAKPKFLEGMLVLVTDTDHIALKCMATEFRLLLPTHTHIKKYK